ncbi:sugar kinase [Mangrovicoccus algicola]|uniref:Sugar kinase n=1 Tax=Mangrovicoccus algicola TaxID=2771008 RepID=A0A8J6YSU6_9RHOB|nr:sugar kinase [Mangrovicoccus algicola]MBE3636787.1 sugar kinase [Mangrovicoccus algicola]
MDQSPPSTPRILAIGECMIEFSPAGEAEAYRRGFAGDTFNTAWYIRQVRPQALVSYLTAIGDDAVSDRFLAFLDETGIDRRFVRQVPGGTMGLYLIALKDGERSFSYWRDMSAARLLAENSRRLDQAMAEADTIYFSGITLAILSDPARTRLFRALERARVQGRLVAFDPNLRPRLWEDAATMRDRTMQAAALSDLVLPSFEDEATHFGDADPQATIARYRAAGTLAVTVKNGPGAVHYLEGAAQGVVEIPAAAEVVDTTSAGDSFNAVYLACLGDEGMTIRDRILAAAAMARHCIGGRGALVPLKDAAVL